MAHPDREERKNSAADFGFGLMRGVCLFILPGLLVIIAYDWASSRFGWRATDDTDLSSVQRSGLALRTDYGTGCQYLETAAGNLTPRLNADGEHVCEVAQ